MSTAGVSSYGDRRERPRRASRESHRSDHLPTENSAPAMAVVVADVSSWGVTQDQARDMLRHQMCPVCGKGPWKSPLNHAAKKHGIRKHDLRDACGLTMVESVVDPELAARFSERQKAIGFDGGTIVVRGKRGPYRTTAAGRAATAGNFRAVSNEVRRQNAAKGKTAEAKKKQSEALKASWAARGVQPCGTTGAYRRGCRCEQCREAMRTYQRSRR